MEPKKKKLLMKRRSDRNQTAGPLARLLTVAMLLDLPLWYQQHHFETRGHMTQRSPHFLSTPFVVCALLHCTRARRQRERVANLGTRRRIRFRSRIHSIGARGSGRTSTQTPPSSPSAGAEDLRQTANRRPSTRLSPVDPSVRLFLSLKLFGL